jgi:peptidoglycan/xylan/chitin deacetylase (PgdA/CDA1 family)
VLRLTSLGLAGVLLLSAAATPSAAADTTVRLIYHGARTKPVVALTFDDGYSASNCGKVLDILQAKHVMATFFPYARAVKGSPAFWRRVADAGYPIANHTTSHPMLTNLTLAQATREISAARSIIEKVTGKPMIRVFRPPYGAWNKMVVEAARAAGFPTILLWDVDDRDWSRSMTASGMLRAAEKGRSGSVILMHCGPSVTPTILGRVIDFYRSRGYGFVTVPELLSGEVPARAFGPPAPAVTPPPPPPSPRPQPVDPDRAPFSLSDLVWIHRHEVFAF